MRRRAFRLGFLVALALGVGASADAVEALSDAGVSPKTEGSIGVAPFERAGAARGALPDVAALLAQRLSTRGVERVVGPTELSSTALADPRPDQVVEWADRAGVEAVVVGRTTRIGSRLSVDARLRAGASGHRMGSPFYAEVSRPEDLANAVDDLAAEVLGRIASLPAPRPPASSAPAASVSAAPPAGEARPRPPYRRDEPIEIHADELEARDDAGRKKFLFRGNVRAEQGELSLRSDRLEAFYPEGASQPERLVARGDVVIRQGERTAQCDRATLYRAQERVVCSGNASLEQQCDRVRGSEIVFHLDREVLKVNGAADVRIHPREADCEARAGATP